jgi:transposase-like protein
MSVLSKPCFHDEAAAFEHVEAVLWPDGPICPKCGSVDSAYRLKGVRSKPSKKNPKGVERHGLWKCRECRSQFTVRIGTIFEESHLPLHKWLQAIHLVCSSKKGISGHQLHRVLEVTYKTAWFLAHRIREAMIGGDLGPLGGEGKTVEADETYFGNVKAARQRSVFINGKGWVRRGGGQEKFKVMSLVERGGSVRSIHVDYLTAQTAGHVVLNNIDRKSALMTDESNIYKWVGTVYASHESVNHSREEWVRGLAHTNTIEGFFSIFKRGMKGVYQHCSEKHLHRYLAEFDFRYNTRSAVGIEDAERAERALKGVAGKRLTYR